jgi:ketosteroid isomerase-like protein
LEKPRTKQLGFPTLTTAPTITPNLPLAVAKADPLVLICSGKPSSRWGALYLFPFAILAVAIAFSSSCAKPSPDALAKRFIEAENKAWSTGDVSDLKAIESDDVIYHIPGTDLKGWKAHEDYIVQGRQTVSDLKQSWKYLSGEGDHFIMSYESSAIMLANGITPATSISLNYLCAFRISDGQDRRGLDEREHNDDPRGGNEKVTEISRFSPCYRIRACRMNFWIA